MSAVRMDGKALSAKVRGSILAETEELKKQGVGVLFVSSVIAWAVSDDMLTLLFSVFRICVSPE